MKNKNFFSVILIALLVVLGCQNKKKSKEIENSDKTDIVHNAKNSIDWVGTYFGVLHCSSCPGINTLITLDTDGTYEKTVEYLQSKEVPKTTKGNFKWDNENNSITIEENTYLVEKNKLFILDANNKKIEGNLAKNSILTKIELEPVPDVNEGYSLQMFTGNDNKNYNIIFNTNPEIPTALVETDGFKKILSQTQVWAKGAEYSGNDTKLIANGDKATLVIKSQKIELKRK